MVTEPGLDADAAVRLGLYAYNVARKFFGPRTDLVQEAVQETLTRTCERWDRANQRGCPEAWVVNTATHVCQELLLVSVVVLVAGRDEPADQLQAGPGPQGGPFRVGGVVEVTAANGKIAFLRSARSTDPPSIYLMNEDGSEQTKIAETTQGGGLGWSPDGTALVFNDVGGIYTINADGTGERRIPNGSSHDGWPSLSPDGTKVALRDVDAGGIVVTNVDGSGRRTLTKNLGDLSPAWSPDGRGIAFTRNDDIWVMNADGSGQRPLVALPGIEASPAWSPDGRQIAFRHNSDISVVDVDGGRARALISPGGTVAVDPQGQGANKLAVTRGDPDRPRWSPDGTKLVFTIWQTGDACSIWVISADGGVQTRLTDNRTCDRDPAWQPRPR
ncbi:MAG: hypothetical protein ACR2HM_05485 [Acidimicrobiales bacterium]